MRKCVLVSEMIEVFENMELTLTMELAGCYCCVKALQRDNEKPRASN